MPRIKNVLAEIELDRLRPLPPQIYSQVRSLILSGAFTPDERIPSTRDLAKLWDILPPTVQSGLAPLVKEGLLIRHRGIGTHVRRREEKLTRVGIYLLDHYNSRDGSPFARSVAQQVHSLLHEQGVEPEVWVDPRPHFQQGAPWPVLMQAIEQRRIEGLVVPQAGLPVTNWLAKLPIPWTVADGSGRPNTVALDMHQFVAAGVQALADQGCRSVGFIYPVSVEPLNYDGTVNPSAKAFEQFIDVCRERGLVFRDEWVFAERAENRDLPREQMGYALVHQLWSCRQRPDGLLIFPDHLVGSAMAALLELGVRVPADLKLAVHKNRHIALFCPCPATFLVSDEAKIARALVAQMHRQWRGEECEPMTIAFDLESNADSQQTKQTRKGTGKDQQS